MENIQSILDKIKIKDVLSLLKSKFEVERMNRFFDIDGKYEFLTKHIMLNSSNSIFLGFRGIDKVQTYNLLLILELCRENNFSLKLQNQIRRIAENNIDMIVIWCIEPINPDAAQALKVSNTNFVHISPREIESVGFISNFFPCGTNYNYAVVINKLTDLLVMRLKKLFHLVLSEIAAPLYDDEYGSDKIGTQAIMEFEEKILFKCINRLNYELGEVKPKVAIDVGCGTGRHSINTLAKHFDRIYGFDFSPKMIEVANQKKRRKNLKQVVFSVADLEYEDIMYENEYLRQTDLVVASFGMGSFIENTAKMLRRFYEWLKPGGMLLLSFYNKDSILLNITPNWRDTSLSAHIDVDNNALKVQLTPEVIFQIYCKPYDNNVKAEISKKFNIDNIYTFPTTMALLPNSLLKNELAKKLFKKIDRDLAQDKEYSHGHYVLIVAHKVKEPVENGYKNVMSVLEQNKVDYDTIDHDLVLSVEDVKKEIGYHPGCMIKTIIFRDKTSNTFVSVSLPSEKRINKEKLAEHLGISSKKLKFASEKEVAKLGFPIGGIPPFGFSSEQKVRSFIDEDLMKPSDDVCYMGIGDNQKTLKLNAQSFQKVIEKYERLQIPHES